MNIYINFIPNIYILEFLILNKSKGTKDNKNNSDNANYEVN